MKTQRLIPVKCPICEGHKIVAGGFYISTGPYMTSDCATEICRQCGGSGIMTMTEIIETDKIVRL